MEQELEPDPKTVALSHCMLGCHAVVVEQRQIPVKACSFFVKYENVKTYVFYLQLKDHGQLGILGVRALPPVAQGHKVGPEATLVECLVLEALQIHRVVRVRLLNCNIYSKSQTHCFSFS